jgi:hypothetical protein
MEVQCISCQSDNYNLSATCNVASTANDCVSALQSDAQEINGATDSANLK